MKLDVGYKFALVNVNNKLIVLKELKLANFFVLLKKSESKKCEEFLHTFNMKICTHKTHLEVKLLCSCSLTNKVVQCNAMKFTKNLMRCVHLENTKSLWENHNSP